VITLKDLAGYTNTEARRQVFFSWSTTQFAQDQAVYYLLVKHYRLTPKKKQAQLIKEWFLDGKIPDDLQDKGFLSRVNIAASVRDEVGKTAGYYASIRTFRDKVAYFANKGFGAGSIGAAIGLKLSGKTKPPADLFDATLTTDFLIMLDDSIRRGYRPDGPYQANGTFKTQTQKLRTHLQLAGFEPDFLGVY
jgi:hypothetical protein